MAMRMRVEGEVNVALAISFVVIGLIFSFCSKMKSTIVFSLLENFVVSRRSRMSIVKFSFFRIISKIETREKLKRLEGKEQRVLEMNPPAS